MNLQTLIKEALEVKLADSSVFLVNLQIVEDKKRINVFLDGDTAVSIEDCTSVSRDLREKLIEAGVEMDEYETIVSSPGVEYPLINHRQYNKHIGRTFAVQTADNTLLTGNLISATETEIELEIVEGKGKNKTLTLVKVPHTTIKEAKIVISFK